MHILIVKDASTQVPRDCSLEEAQDLAAGGMPIFVVTGQDENGLFKVPLADWVAVQEAPAADPVEPEQPEVVVEAEEPAAPAVTPAKPKPAAKKAAKK